MVKDLDTKSINLSIVIPCLNEEETIDVCIKKCFDVFKILKINGEVIVVDNMSTDKSVQVAKNAGANVLQNTVKGYGATVRLGLKLAKGTYVLMGDADNSYDFYEIVKFWENRNNGDMLLGSRFKGVIHDGAMPALHRYFGTPFLTMFLNILFNIKISDSQCGMRLFKKSTLDLICLNSNGMEFASELLVKYAINNLKIVEIPITLHKDGRTNHKSHLRPFRDGFIHLFYMLKIRFLESKKWKIK